MDIRNNLLRDISKRYVLKLSDVVDMHEAESIISILIEHLFGYNRIYLSMNSDIRLSESEILRFQAAFKQLKQNKPVQYITGTARFMDFDFIVNPNVLIPRQETEELVDLIKKNEKTIGPKVLDIGTGSGCIAISLFHYLNEPHIHALDIDEGALKVAKLNAEKNETEIVFHQIDILNYKGDLSENVFDVIVSNPPYVTSSDKQYMKANVLDYEPPKALFVNDYNPLVFYGAILDFSEKNLKDGGRIYFEINESFADEIKILMTGYGYENVLIHHDLNGKTRMISARKTG